MKQLNLFSHTKFVPGHGYYFNNPIMYTCGIYCEVLGVDNKLALEKWDKETIQWHIDFALQTNHVPLLIWPTTDLQRHYFTDEVLKYGTNFRLAVVHPCALSEVKEFFNI
ncbi:MAG: hypothetical protein QY317_16255 [Candidatus Jettenia caeni]|nr:MAG: hypothetical protein QY317_16255 [Candidatus Jettenia caeni]